MKTIASLRQGASKLQDSFVKDHEQAQSERARLERELEAAEQAVVAKHIQMSESSWKAEWVTEKLKDIESRVYGVVGGEWSALEKIKENLIQVKQGVIALNNHVGRELTMEAEGTEIVVEHLASTTAQLNEVQLALAMKTEEADDLRASLREAQQAQLRHARHVKSGEVTREMFVAAGGTDEEFDRLDKDHNDLLDKEELAAKTRCIESQARKIETMQQRINELEQSVREEARGKAQIEESLFVCKNSEKAHVERCAHLDGQLRKLRGELLELNKGRISASITGDASKQRRSDHPSGVDAVESRIERHEKIQGLEKALAESKSELEQERRDLDGKIASLQKQLGESKELAVKSEKRLHAANVESNVKSKKLAQMEEELLGMSKLLNQTRDGIHHAREREQVTPIGVPERLTKGVAGGSVEWGSDRGRC